MTMHANDWQDAESARNLAIAQLAEVCAAMGLSWTAVEKQFIIELPDVVLSRVTPDSTPRVRKSFDITKWGNSSGVFEDQLPPVDKPLDEGEAPDATPTE